jgi:hypothetical protein
MGVTFFAFFAPPDLPSLFFLFFGEGEDLSLISYGQVQTSGRRKFAPGNSEGERRE